MRGAATASTSRSGVTVRRSQQKAVSAGLRGPLPAGATRPILVRNSRYAAPVDTSWDNGGKVLTSGHASGVHFLTPTWRRSNARATPIDSPVDGSSTGANIERATAPLAAS